MERLQMVLYDELYQSSQLEGNEYLLQLAKWKLLYHPLDQPEEASAMLSSANSLLSKLVSALPMGSNPSSPELQAHSCSAVSKELSGIVQERSRLSTELLAGRKSPSEAAQELLPSPLFQTVDRRAGLTLKEYRE